VAGQPPALCASGEVGAGQIQGSDERRPAGQLYEDHWRKHKIKVFEETGDVDFGYEIPPGRYRAETIYAKNGVARLSGKSPTRS